MFELIEALRTSGTVRQFTDDPVDHATVSAILDTARFAPSGGNRQPWRVAVVSDRALRSLIAAEMQAVWDEYMDAVEAGRTPFAAGSTSAQPAAERRHRHNPLIDTLVDAPVVLAVAVDLNRVALMDGAVGRTPVTAGASIYPFCWSVLLAARAHGLGGVLTTFLSRAEAAAGPALGLPPDHALAATIVLGVPVHQNTRLTRHPVTSFATVDRFDGLPLG